MTSKLKPNNFIISSGKKISGRKILDIAYKLNKLDYKNYFKINKKFIRKNEKKILVGSNKNVQYLKDNFSFRFKIYKNKIIEKMYKSL